MYQVGIWSHSISEESSNFREFKNPLDTLEREGKEGNLQDAFVLMVTDNSTVEAALYKGTSTSPLLLSLVCKFHILKMTYGFSILMVHGSGKRMIAQGTDGISCGVLNKGVMSGKNMMDFLPLHLPPSKRDDMIISWVRLWAGKNLKVLEPKDWFTRGHDIVGGVQSQ